MLRKATLTITGSLLRSACRLMPYLTQGNYQPHEVPLIALGQFPGTRPCQRVARQPQIEPWISRHTLHADRVESLTIFRISFSATTEFIFEQPTQKYGLPTQFPRQMG
eukprot:TRINITY_DN1008_c0_g1_i11.p1 TRINITY_DN1008_c0_g1~~TRINITY_DN1008_c0_g1_i11.p1  ORF type:complete len:108 (+),score=1.18 TRINITY_DN1008_c0_g1_i11:846-1169(+)